MRSLVCKKEREQLYRLLMERWLNTFKLTWNSFFLSWKSSRWVLLSITPNYTLQYQDWALHFSTLALHYATYSIYYTTWVIYYTTWALHCTTFIYIPPPQKKYSVVRGESSTYFKGVQYPISWYVCDLGAHAKFQNPRKPPQKRPHTKLERRRERERDI